MANAITQTTFGGAVSSPGDFTAGQSFSILSARQTGAVAFVSGSMGAAGTGESLSYEETASFEGYFLGGNFLVDFSGELNRKRLRQRDVRGPVEWRCCL